MSAPEQPRRLTPTERLHEVTMSVLQRQASPPEHTSEITRNARGVYQFTVTVRGYSLNDVLAQARVAADELDTAYPYPVPVDDTAERLEETVATIDKARARKRGDAA
jgi:hypothetical protein